MNMSYFNVLPSNLLSQIPNIGNSDEFIATHEFPQKYTDGTIIIDDTNCHSNNQNSDLHKIQDWVTDWHVLGVSPNHSKLNITTPTSSATQCYCNSSLNFKNNQWSASNFSQWCSTRPARNKWKRKRKRTIFTTEQIVVLEGIFQRKPYITREERIAMTNSLQVSEKSIKVWFQNRRRITDKNCREYSADSPSSIDTADSFSDRLTLIEEEIKVNTDENGYVTLNDNVMSLLVGVIDDYLSKDVKLCDEEEFFDTAAPEYTAMYEPISPASSEDTYE